ncbi:hypothetical protein [Streptomyces sp. NRRL F-5135]|uniref:hypothetical protein n=1 Tax=Streptomyces sp. NRRL F-5135 TaxID=1463858 RepID=UPI00131AAC13|nr:hypothetical protein [Streptomyces sp. NRRL F-5135]
MDSEVSYMVRGATRDACQEALDRLCRLLDASPTTRPTDTVGRGWVARAVPAPSKAPTAGSSRGPVASG